MIGYFRQNETLTILCVQVALTMVGLGLIMPILPLYAQRFGANVSFVGLLVTAFGFARLITDIPAGNIAGRWGCRPVLIAGTLILTAGSIAGGFASSYWQIFIFRVIQGVGSATCATAGMIMLSRTTTQANRAHSMSLYQGSTLLGNGLGPTLGGIIAQYLGLRAPFFVYALLCLAAGIWIYLRLHESRPASPPQELPASQADHRVSPALPRTGVRPLLQDRNFILISGVMFGIFFASRGIFNQILPLLANNRLGLGPGQIGSAMTAYFFLNFASLLVVGRLSDRYGRKALITPGCLAIAAAVVMLSQATDYWTLFLICAVWGMSAGISGAIPAAYVVDIVPKENYASAMGLFRAVGDVGLISGPLFLGWLADMKGFNFSLQINAAILFLAVLLFQILAKEPGRNKPGVPV